ncbi:MAG: hypothetical protein JWM76_3863 [Pseudonocardiales bacterium]|nr:hypothetical protein [Pseudonocardiales bacterium]
MEMSHAVAANLAALTGALDEPGPDLAPLIGRLGESCALAVRSYLGFSITLVVDEVPVSFSVLEAFLDPAEILTSVMFPLTALGERAVGSEVILYAGTAGAFVDLAADFSYALGSSADAVQLDRHLIPPARRDGSDGLAKLARRNQAIGILLDRGYDEPDAITELREVARLGAVSVDAVAQQVIDSTARPARS